jgi:hypothetical protein
MPQAIGVIGETGSGGVDKATNCEPSKIRRARRSDLSRR